MVKVLSELVTLSDKSGRLAGDSQRGRLYQQAPALRKEEGARRVGSRRGHTAAAEGRLAIKEFNGLHQVSRCPGYKVVCAAVREVMKQLSSVRAPGRLPQCPSLRRVATGR